MKKFTFVSIMLFVVIVFAISIRFSTSEDSWVCVNSEWVKRGNPKNLPPMTPCGDTSAILDFKETGRLVKDNPGLKPGVWFLVYEKPGAPALFKELFFDENSKCELGNNEGQCPDILLLSSAYTTVIGETKNNIVFVKNAFSGK